MATAICMLKALWAMCFCVWACELVPRAGENAYLRIGLALAILKVVSPDLVCSKIGFSIRGLFSIRKKG